MPHEGGIGLHRELSFDFQPMDALDDVHHKLKGQGQGHGRQERDQPLGVVPGEDVIHEEAGKDGCKELDPREEDSGEHDKHKGRGSALQPLLGKFPDTPGLAGGTNSSVYSKQSTMPVKDSSNSSRETSTLPRAGSFSTTLFFLKPHRTTKWLKFQ